MLDLVLDFSKKAHEAARRGDFDRAEELQKTVEETLLKLYALLSLE